MKLIFLYPEEKKEQVEKIKNILMESTNAVLSIEQKGSKIVFRIYFYKTDEMYKIFQLMKNFHMSPEKIIPARLINHLFPSREEKEARKFFKNGV